MNLQEASKGGTQNTRGGTGQSAPTGPPGPESNHFVTP